MLSQPVKKVVAISLSAAFAIAIVKGAVYFFTGSQAVFADWIESSVHIWIACLMALSLSYSAKPPDHEHRYGHGKITYFSAALEGLVVIFAGFGTLCSAFYALWRVSALENLGGGMLFELLIAAANAMLGRYVLTSGNTHRNLAMIAHGKHILADMWTTLGVVASLGTTWLTGWIWLDGAVGCYFGFHIAWIGLAICRQAYQGLMERIDDKMHAAILKILNRAVEERRISDYHQLRHRRVNDSVWIEVHMLFDGELPLKEVHSRATDVEMQLINRFEGDTVYVTSHLEPLSHEEAHPPSHPESIPLY